MKLNKVNELVSFGAMLDVKVTPVLIQGDEYKVHIMDVVLTDYIPAVLYLQQCQKTWFPDNAYLVA